MSIIEGRFDEYVKEFAAIIPSSFMCAAKEKASAPWVTQYISEITRVRIQMTIAEKQVEQIYPAETVSLLTGAV